MDLQIQDFFVEYPSIYEKEFQYLIGSKKEFYDLKLSLKEEVPERGNFFLHQTIVHRYLRAYDELLIFHSTGTGKSRSVSGLAEYFKKNKSYINHVYILVKGKTLRREIQHDIICAYPEEYMNEKISKSFSGKSLAQNISNSLKQWYSIKTQKKFAFELRSKYWTKSDKTLAYIEDEKEKKRGKGKEEESGKRKRKKQLGWHLGTPDIDAIERDYSGCIFWIDEAHNLRVDPTDFTLNEDVAEMSKKVREKEVVYQTLFVLFHAIKRSKRILTTATPMVDDPSEIGSLMNLILPYNLRNPKDPTNLQFHSNFDYAGATLEKLTPYFQGRVSYLRAFETGAVPRYLGTPIGEQEDKGITINYKTVIYSTIMSEHQTQGYSRSISYVYKSKDKKKLFKQIGVAKPVQGHGIYTPEIQASDFVYPDGSFGPDGFKKYITKVSSDFYQANNELSINIEDPENIKIFSSKYADICSRLAFKTEHLRIDQETGEPIPPDAGNFFIYATLLEGSGLIVLTMCLEALGFKKFNETKSIFSSEGQELDYCASRINIAEPRKTNIEPAPRYALIGKDASDSKIAAIMDAMNSYENRHGDYIKVLLSSPIGKEGINVANILNIEIIDSEWNPSGTFQALSRGIRATSHEDLLKEIAKDQGIPKEDIIIDINIRLHCAVPVTDELYTAEELVDMSDETIGEFYKQNKIKLPDDKIRQITLLVEKRLNVKGWFNLSPINEDMYMTSERKSKEIKHVERFMKQISFDCWLNYLRNVRPGEAEGSIQCDYQECEYKCINEAPNLEKFDDRSTFDLLYADYFLELVGKDIIKYFSSNFVSTLQQLYKFFEGKYEAKYIGMAMDKLIRAKTQLLDRYGFTSYLREEQGTIYLSREYPVRNREQVVDMYPLLGYYSSLIAESSSNIATLTTQANEPLEMEKVAKIQITDEDFSKKIEDISFTARMKLLETALIHHANNTSTEMDDHIADKYNFYWTMIEIPYSQLNTEQQIMTGKGSKQSKKPAKIIKRMSRTELDEEEKRSLKEEEESTETAEGDQIYVHILGLLNKIENLVSRYNLMAIFLKAETEYRLYQPGVDKAFRDASPYETKVYNKIMQAKIYEKFRPYSKMVLFGTIVKGVFRIGYSGNESHLAANDNRYGKKSMVCMSYSIAELVNFLWELNVLPRKEIRPKLTLTSEQMANFIKSKGVQGVEEFKYPKLVFYTAWYSTSFQKKHYCAFIRNYLEEHNSVFIP